MEQELLPSPADNATPTDEYRRSRQPVPTKVLNRILAHEQSAPTFFRAMAGEIISAKNKLKLDHAGFYALHESTYTALLNLCIYTGEYGKDQGLSKPALASAKSVCTASKQHDTKTTVWLNLDAGKKAEWETWSTYERTRLMVDYTTLGELWLWCAWRGKAEEIKQLYRDITTSTNSGYTQDCWRRINYLLEDLP